MKLKKIVTLLGSAIGVIGLSTNAMATEITVPIKADLNTICGYVAEITYNPDELTPVLAGSDILGDDCYATSNISSGYLNADLIEDCKIVIGWADKTETDLTMVGNILANVVFSVNENTTATETTVSSKLFEIARYPDVMAANDEITSSDKFDISGVIADTVESGESVELFVDDESVSDSLAVTSNEDTQQTESLAATEKLE